jgi:hypothetical protein
MGSIDRWFDQLDERKVKLISKTQQQSTREKNCILS